MKKLLFLSDVHIPYHDKVAYRLLLKVAARFKPDILVIAGDFIDNYTVSAHEKTYLRMGDFQAEIDEAQAAIRELEGLADRLVFVSGNHEDRWPRYLARVSPGDNRRCNSIPGLLGLGKRWQYVPYRDHVRIGKLYVTHDTGVAGKYAIHRAVADFQSNVVIGHLHRQGLVYEGDAAGKTHVGACFGWLGDVEQVDYMHRIKARRDWQLGFGIGYMEPSGAVHLQAIPIVGYRCVVDGDLYQAYGQVAA